MRLSRIAALWESVNRPAIDAPARWTTASTPSSRSGAGSRVPASFVGALRFPAHQADYLVATRGQEGRQGSTHESARSGHRDRPGSDALRVRPAVAREIVGELAVPVTEGLGEETARYRRVDAIGDAGAEFVDDVEAVFVAPRADDGGGARQQAVVGEFVHETCWRVVILGSVPGDPAQTAGETEDGRTGFEGVGLGDDVHRLPGRDQAEDGAGPGVPVEHLVTRCVDDAREFDAHALPPVCSDAHPVVTAPGRPVVTAPGRTPAPYPLKQEGR